MIVCADVRKNPRPAPRCDGVEWVGRGHAYYASYSNRELGVFVVAVGEFFSFRRNWHRDKRARRLVRQYQRTLDAILRAHSDLASCAVRCRRCGIRFLTHPRNAHRRDLRCEFGCREYHRQQLANARSKKHYRTDRGRRNKKHHNGKRSASGDVAESGVSPEVSPPDTIPADVDSFCSDISSAVKPASPPLPAPHPAPQIALEEPPAEDVQLMLDGFALNEATLVNSPMLPYLAMVASVLEGRLIRPEELLQALRRSLRQRSFDRLPRREYVLRFLNQHPP